MKARKRFGQHFLEPAWADRVVHAIAPGPGDRFLEIGPGTGVLTLRLAPRVDHLTAVEVDRDLAAALLTAVPPNVSILQEDVLAIDLEALLAGRRWRVAGNLPYNISSPILFALLRAWRRSQSLADATLMVQREVADRLAAAPGGGDYGVLSISIQRHALVRRVLALPPGAFRPQPRVNSAVVQLTFRQPEDAVLDEQVFDAMVRSMFTQRRKTLANALERFAAARGHAAREVLARAAIEATRRPETLQPSELARLADALTPGGRPIS